MCEFKVFFPQMFQFFTFLDLFKQCESMNCFISIYAKEIDARIMKGIQYPSILFVWRFVISFDISTDMSNILGEFFHFFVD